MSETSSYTEGETLKDKSEGFQEDHMGWFQKEGLLFLPGNLQWKLVNSLHATTHLGEKALQRLLERSFRGIGFQTTIRQVVSSCPTCHLNNPQGARVAVMAHRAWAVATVHREWPRGATHRPRSRAEDRRTPCPRGSGQEELPHVRCQGQQPRVPGCDNTGTA